MKIKYFFHSQVLLRCLIFFYSINISAQDTIRSEKFKNTLKSTSPGPEKVALYLQLSKYYESFAPDSSLFYARQGLVLSQKLNLKLHGADCQMEIGVLLMHKGDYDTALENQLQALQLYTKLNEKNKIGECLNLIGILYNYKSNYDKAVDYFLQSLRAREEIKDNDGMAKAMLNIGNALNMQGNKKSAFNYFNQALAIYEKNKEEKNIAFVFNSLARLYIQQKEYHTSLNYLSRASKILEKYLNESEYGNTLSITSDVYIHLGNYSKALEYAYKTLKIIEARLHERSAILSKIANIYQLTGKNEVALKYAKEAMENANRFQSKVDIEIAAFQLASIYKGLKEYEISLKYYELGNGIKDNIYNLEKAKIINGLEIDYRLEKQQTQIMLLEKERLLREEESKNQNLQRNFLIIAVLMTSLAAIVFLRGSILLKRTHRLQVRQQKEIIAKNLELELQKQEIEQQSMSLREANEEIKLKNEELSLINETLDEKVQERTLILRQQNKQLREYGFMNAHRLRAPVASVLGLVHLIKISEMHKQTDPELIDHLLQASTQLDKIVHEIQETIEPYYPKKKEL